MAIEIKELHIKINVDEGKKRSGTANVSKENKKDITAECVEYVMETLQRQKER
ncbi:DUF5908 family protein [Sinomicrobium kalidii]|uniref:DUF5908 family protein n=1 Tax=Sinomicrobium kalidii TaxID=2900738 RepID=UPI001E4E88EF|nr:DUF5908 family protein [Sinomicrobium kalidii]UGU16068.1 DUF5908 family protein [Sinomicrobium kalidii]